MNITPTNAAMGRRSIKGAPNITNIRSITDAVIPLSLARAPLLMLIRLWPIIAQPPMPLKKPLSMLAAP